MRRRISVVADDSGNAEVLGLAKLTQVIRERELRRGYILGVPLLLNFSHELFLL